MALTWSGCYHCDTSHSGIFAVDTVMTSNCIGRAAVKAGLSAHTVHIVKPNVASALTKGSLDGGLVACEKNTFIYLTSMQAH